MISSYIQAIIILYLMAHITLYQWYYSLLMVRTTKEYKDNPKVKKLKIELKYMSNKFYHMMMAFIVYFWITSGGIIPAIANPVISYTTQAICVLTGLFFLYIQKFVLNSYERAIISANKNLQKP